MRRLLLSLVLAGAAAVAGCGRPLTANETAFAARLFGDTLDVAPVRINTAGPVGMIETRFAVRPQTTCRERIVPPPQTAWLRTRTAGMALGNQIMVRESLGRADYARTSDGSMNLGAAMFLAHELTHVWQWQNRAQTGYSPLGVGAEHRPGTDPYLFDTDAHARFADFGYEQQASIVEEYVCCAALDPEGARTRRLRALMAQVMQPDDLPRVALRLPWAGVERRGICS